MSLLTSKCVDHLGGMGGRQEEQRVLLVLRGLVDPEELDPAVLADRPIGSPPPNQSLIGNRGRSHQTFLVTCTQENRCL